MMMAPFIMVWKIFSLFTNHQKLCTRFLKACNRAKKYDKIGLLPFSGFDKRWIWNKEWYDKVVSMPFAYMDISCPGDYDSILKQQFGDYSVFKKGTAVHSMVLWDPEIPYKVKMRKHLKR